MRTCTYMYIKTVQTTAYFFCTSVAHTNLTYYIIKCLYSALSYQ